MAEHRTTKMFHENVTEEFQEDQIKGSLVNGEGVQATPAHGQSEEAVTVWLMGDDLPPKDDGESPEVSYDDLHSESDSNDPWALPELQDVSTKWSELSTSGRVKRVLVEWIGKAIGLVCLLYIFICSLDLLGSAFQLLGGKASGEAFSDSELIQNPIAGLMIGILATVLVQSSSTSTSIVVTMVASGILQVRPAIPIIMGANIGTSVTNTIVSLAQSGDREEFRRAFGGATVHDMFNWLCVILLLPLEIASGYLFHLTNAIVASYHLNATAGEKHDMLKVVTKPFTKLIIQLDKKIIEKIATGHEEYMEKSLIKEWCKYEEVTKLVNKTMLLNISSSGNESFQLNFTTGVNETVKQGVQKCSFLFNQDLGLGDTVTGFILLALSLFILCTCLVLLVKLLHSILRGQIANVIKKTLNSDLPGKCSYFTDYIAILIGAGMTILVQSSSVFTSAMTPLVGMGVITIDRMYPLTLGSNIGTTATGLLAAMASPGDRLAAALQISLCHLMFNISGIIIFFPVPVMRKVPIRLAKMLGNTTAKYRWFPIMYVIVMFFLLPGAAFGLSYAGTIALCAIGIPILILFIIIIIINVIQNKKPKLLPVRLRTWKAAGVPLCLRSLKPLDNKMQAVINCFGPCCTKICCQTTTKQPKDGAIPKTEKLRNQLESGLVGEVNHVAVLKYSPSSSHNSSTASSRSTSMLLPTRL